MWDGTASDTGLTIRVWTAADNQEIVFTRNVNNAGAFTDLTTNEWIIQFGNLLYNGTYAEGDQRNTAIHNKELNATEISNWLNTGVSGAEISRWEFKGTPEDSIGSGHGNTIGSTYTHSGFNY